ncbi:MAG: hypothetical protein JO314_14125 [Acidobacteria bacterium]|nr:hypothetical protein [Acidobacteriota bacterium]
MRRCLIAGAAVVVGVAVAAFWMPKTAGAHDGEEMNVHNHTGHEVVVFLFDDAEVHLNEHGGVQFADLKDGESAVAHVPHCTFSVVLVDHEDIWHAEFHDCHSTDMTFTSTTGHAKRQD